MTHKNEAANLSEVLLSQEDLVDDYVDPYDQPVSEKPIPLRKPGPYALLEAILENAYEQAAFGKGKDRHANGKPFDRQPIMEIARMVGVGYQTGQAMKKCQEATSMAARGEQEAAISELLGAINYCAAAVLLIRER